MIAHERGRSRRWAKRVTITPFSAIWPGGWASEREDIGSAAVTDGFMIAHERGRSRRWAKRVTITPFSAIWPGGWAS
ncbi:hypothetical protein C0U44_31340, partial [Klebsiella pneumoniae]